jgi:capsular exopolysaccharide synthesis family protein
VAVEQLDDTVKSPDEARERFDLTVLGTIPRIKEPASGRRAVEDAGHRLVTHLDPRSPVGEAYRSLRTNLAFARAHEPLKTILLSSPGPSDGKSTTVANLAITFAQQGQRTLLIDADLRRAVLDKLFTVPREPGLTDVLVGRAPLQQVVSETVIHNLHVMGSGPFPPNPSELLGSQSMREVLREAREHYDVVLLDSPPLLAVTDAAVLSTMVDGAILVVRTGATPRTSVRRAVSQLETVHGRLIGTVLNDVDFRWASTGAATDTITTSTTARTDTATGPTAEDCSAVCGSGRGGAARSRRSARERYGPCERSGTRRTPDAPGARAADGSGTLGR